MRAQQGSFLKQKNNMGGKSIRSFCDSVKVLMTCNFVQHFYRIARNVPNILTERVTSHSSAILEQITIENNCTYTVCA